MIFFRRETDPPPACAGTNVKQSTTVLHLLYNNADESFDIRNDLFIACMVQCHEQNLVTHYLKKVYYQFPNYEDTGRLLPQCAHFDGSAHDRGFANGTQTILLRIRRSRFQLTFCTAFGTVLSSLLMFTSNSRTDILSR